MPYNTKEKIMAYQKKWAAGNVNKTIRYKQRHNLKLLYGISIEEYNRMFNEQEGKCAICGIHQSELKKSLCVDHSHKTKKVRGLLCHLCNLGIGHLQDDIENLRCAVLYLNKND